MCVCACIQSIHTFFLVFSFLWWYRSLLFQRVDQPSKSCLESDSQQSLHQILMKCFSHSADVLLQGTCGSVNNQGRSFHRPVCSHRDAHIHTGRQSRTDSLKSAIYETAVSFRFIFLAQPFQTGLFHQNLKPRRYHRK